MEGNSSPSSSLADVRLIVKSANQQFEDLIIHSGPTWTIRRLKAHLTQVYPSNPTVPEQKLIYSGQLLSDELILKDILRSYKDVETENHIFHLVYTPKMIATKPKTNPQPQEKQPERSSPSPSTSADGLRHRNVTPSETSTATPSSAQIPQQAAYGSNSFAIPQMLAGCPNIPNSNFSYSNMMQFNFPGQFGNDISQQRAAVYNWLQQVYINYIDQCLRMANGTLNDNTMQSHAISIPPFLPNPDYIPAPQVATASIGTAGSSIPTVEIDGPSTSRAAAAGITARGAPVLPATAQPQPADATPVPPVAAPADNVEQPQPRFPNIVQEEQDNRDWLDSFYSITRLLALLTLVYVYSSPLRCLVVTIIAVGIYLYHNGFFQTRRPAQVNNRNINNNQNINDHNAPAENAEQEPPRPDAARGNASVPARAASLESEPISSLVTPPEIVRNTTSLIAFVRTFIVSFFASLLPETPPL